MAALGWLVSLARAQDKAKEEAVLAQFRAAKDKVPHDPRALWDWYYLELVLGDNTGTYEAARDLSRAAPSDPMALWIYLSSLATRQFGQGPRYSVARGTEGDDGTPPLPPTRSITSWPRTGPAPAPARAGRAADPRAASPSS